MSYLYCPRSSLREFPNRSGFRKASPGQRGDTARAFGCVDESTHKAVLATAAGSVAKCTAEMNRADDSRVQSQWHLERAAGVQLFPPASWVNRRKIAFAGTPTSGETWRR